MSLLGDRKSDSKSYATFLEEEASLLPNRTNPHAKSTLWDKTLFSWVNPLLRQGALRPLVEEDVWDLNESSSCRNNTIQLSKHWTSTTTIFLALIKTYGGRYMITGLALFFSTILELLGPYLMQRMIHAYSSPVLDLSAIGYLVSALFISRVIKAILTAHYSFQSNIVAIDMTAAAKGLIFRKALRLSARSRLEKNTGDIVNMYTVDVSNIISAANSVHYLWVLPIEIIIAMVMLYYTLGWATFAGVATIIIVLFINNKISNGCSDEFELTMKKKDSRMQAVNELFGAINVVKFNAWDEKFEKKIQQLRANEMDSIWSFVWMLSLNIFLLWASPLLVSTITFAVYVLAMGEAMTAGKVFTALALFRLLQEPMRQLPIYVNNFTMARVSVERVKEFTELAEFDPNNVLGPNECAGVPRDVSVCITGGDFSWEAEGNPLVFQDLNLVIKKGELVVVTGKVGTGKSSFCSVLLGDMFKLAGTVYVDGGIAYCGQQAWIQNLTVKENILFGRPYNVSKYQRAIEASGLKPDIAMLDNGDDTEIGEKGVGLSGGQQARVALARAIYSDADIFILDAPLAAIDAIVAKEIFNKCMLTDLKGKTIIMCTHNPEIINHPAVDRHLSINENRHVTVTNRRNADKTEHIPSIHVVREKQASSLFRIGTMDHRLSFSNTAYGNPQHSRRDSIYIPITPSSVGKISTPSSSSRFGRFSSVAEGFQQLERHASFGTAHVPTPSAKPASPDQKFSEDSPQKAKTTKKSAHVEHRATGRIDFKVFRTYFTAAGGMWVFGAVIVIQTIWQALTVSTDLWLNIWLSEPLEKQVAQQSWNVMVYGLISLASVLAVGVRAVTVIYFGRRASNIMFDSMLKSLLRAPMSFFDVNPTGRILNRMADDIGNIDVRFQFVVGTISSVLFSVLGNLLMNVFISPALVLIMIPLTFLYLNVANYYLTTSRELQRIQKVTQSPVLNFVSSGVSGVMTVRAYGQRQITSFINKNETLVDENNKSQYASTATAQWFGLRVQLLGALILLAVTGLLALGHGYLSAGLIGLAITYGLSIDARLQTLVQAWAMLETQMVSPERIQQYIDIKPEAVYHKPEAIPQHEWPSKGEVKFENVSFRYREDMPLVLKKLNLHILPGEKIGVVGRTGSGKTTITMSLFRINEVAGGKVLVDDVDVSQLGLHTLRSNLSIITQAPTLFKGTIRSYMDPFDEYSDLQIWEALAKVALADKVRQNALQLAAVMEEGGDNFSVGERQLLVMGSALMRKSKIVVMDEATAAIDHESDLKLQQVIRSEFKDSTLITIAHRLYTIIDSDRVLVMEAGELKEFDSPRALLAKKSGHFYRLAVEAGLADYYERPENQH